MTGEGRIVGLTGGRLWSANRLRASRACRRHFDSGLRLPSAIAIVASGSQYGHWNHDVFGGLLLWPRAFVAASWVVIAAAHASTAYAAEMLSWVVPPDRVVRVPHCSWVWVGELHDMWPRPVFLEWPVVVAALREYVERRFRLFSRSAPSRCVLMQRGGENGFRHLWNLDEVRAEFARLVPEFAFEIWRCRAHGADFTMVDAVWFYASFLFLLAAEGSNLAATLYMHAGAVVCEIRGARHDWYWTRACWFIGLYHVICRIPQMPSFEPSTAATGTLELSQAARAASVVGPLLRQLRH